VLIGRVQLFDIRTIATVEKRCVRECGIRAGGTRSGTTAAVITVGFSPSHYHDLRGNHAYEARLVPYMDA